MNQGMIRRWRTIRALAAALVVGVLAGCAGPPEQEDDFEPPVYPPPPDDPRYIYEMTLISSAQVNKESEESAWRRMLTGQERGAGEGFSKPFDVEACDGTVFVSDSVSRNVKAFDFTEQAFFRIGVEPPGALRKPLGLSVDAQCRLYVADFTHKRILVYDRDGEYLKSIGEPDDFARLSHVAVTSDGDRVYASDTGTVQDSKGHWIRVYDGRSGEQLHNIGERGAEEGQFNLPRDVAVGPDGRVHVVDGGNFRVQIFQPDGTFVNTFGDIGDQFGQFSRPKGISVDDKGRIYVTDAAFGNFQIFNDEGRLLTFIGNRSEQGGPGQYMLPAGIGVDEKGRIYFVDQFFRKVDIFRPIDLEPGIGNPQESD